MVNINDIITHKFLGMDLWEQAEIDKSTVETLDRAKNALVQSETQCQRNARHFDDSLSCGCCGEGRVSSPFHLETSEAKLTDIVCDAPTFFQRDQWWKSCKQLLGVSGVHDGADKSP